MAARLIEHPGLRFELVPGSFWVEGKRFTPSVLSDREKKLFEDLAKLSSFNPRGHFG